MVTAEMRTPKASTLSGTSSSAARRISTRVTEKKHKKPKQKITATKNNRSSKFHDAVATSSTPSAHNEAATAKYNIEILAGESPRFSNTSCRRKRCSFQV